jgi:uncharacterized membrane-anchored protein
MTRPLTLSLAAFAAALIFGMVGYLGKCTPLQIAAMVVLAVSATVAVVLILWDAAEELHRLDRERR